MGFGGYPESRKKKEVVFMLLAINVGNSRISIGFFADDSKRLVAKFKIATDINKTSDEYLALIRAVVREENLSFEEISGAIVSSVVPQLTGVISETVERFGGKEPVVVGPGVKTGFAIKIDSPSELGADIVANTAAVVSEIGKKGAVIVDLGTVTTVSAINERGEYVGCAIMPGVQISFDALHGRTAQLPNVMLSVPTHAIGKNSQESVRSGVILGHAMILDGMVERFAKEMKCAADSLTLSATGEFALRVIKECKRDFSYDEDLTLKGLYYLYKNNL